MKKKSLNLVLFLMFLSIMFILTGCDNNSESYELSNNSTTNEENINKETVTLFDVTEKYAGDLAIVELKEVDDDGKINYTEYIADETGKLLSKVGSNDYIIQNGYYVYRPDEMDYSYISYKYTEKTYDRTENVAYCCISENGYALIKRKEESLAGDSYYFEIIDQDWNVIYSLKYDTNVINYYYWYGWYFDDIFYIEINSNAGLSSSVILIDASTGKTLEFSDILGVSAYNAIANGNNIKVGDKVITSGLVELENVTSSNILNDKYYLDDDKIYSIETGEVAYDFAKGGADTVYYYDGTYYVLSDTSYLYTMDDNFNIVAEPTKVSNLSNWIYISLTKYGVVGQMNGIIGILDENLEFTQKIASISDVGKLIPDMTENSLNVRYLYIGEGAFNCEYVYDLENMEFIEFWKEAN